MRYRRFVVLVTCCIFVMVLAIPCNAKTMLVAKGIQTERIEKTQDEAAERASEEDMQEIRNVLQTVQDELREMRTSRLVTDFTITIYVAAVPGWLKALAPLLPHAAIVLDESTKFIGRQVGHSVWALQQFRETTQRSLENARRSLERRTGKRCVIIAHPYETDYVCY